MKSENLDFGLVSVIIPCFNAEDFIIATIDNVLKQSYKNIEVIIVDDCSTDSSLSLIKKNYGSNRKISIYSMSVNSGMPAVPRNFGIEKSKGRYIAFIDADDLWHPEKLYLQLKSLNKLDAYMCSTEMINFKDESKIMIDVKYTTGRITKISLFDQMVKYRTPTSSLLLRRDIARKYKFIEDLFYKGREDLVHSLVMHSSEGCSLKLNLPLVYYRQHEKQISANKFKMLLMVFLVISTCDLNKNNWMKILTPYFILTNILYSFYYRVFLSKL